jgi:hypothetical protein
MYFREYLLFIEIDLSYKISGVTYNTKDRLD